MSKADEISAWNAVVNFLEERGVKLSLVPNHPQLMTILMDHPDLATEFYSAADNPSAHVTWYDQLMKVAPAYVEKAAAKKAAKKVKPGTTAAWKLMKLFKKLTDGEPITIRGAQAAIDQGVITPEQIDSLVNGFESDDPDAAYALWETLRWKITEVVDSVE